MIKPDEYDAGKFMDRWYYDILGNFLAQSAMHYNNKNRDELYNVLHNWYGMLPTRIKKTCSHKIEELFKGYIQGTTQTPMYDLWQIRQHLIDSMDDGSMLFNKWARKPHKNILV